MERKINQKVPLKEVVFDEDLYPRAAFNWQTAYDYQQSILAGAKFPPITLVVFKGKKYLVDGKHRLEACKKLKQKNIAAEIFTGWNRAKIFEEAVRRNIAHGRILSPFEKRRIALKLRTMKYPNDKISELIQVPEEKVESFVAQRLTNTLTGETIVKSEIQHVAGTDINTDSISFEGTQKQMYSSNQVRLLQEVVRLFDQKLLDMTNPKVQECLNKLKAHLMLS